MRASWCRKMSPPGKHIRTHRWTDTSKTWCIRRPLLFQFRPSMSVFRFLVIYHYVLWFSVSCVRLNWPTVGFRAHVIVSYRIVSYRPIVGECAFSVAAPRVWNQLPTDLKLCRSGAKLKTFLFTSSYGRKQQLNYLCDALSVNVYRCYNYCSSTTMAAVCERMQTVEYRDSRKFLLLM